MPVRFFPRPAAGRAAATALGLLVGLSGVAAAARPSGAPAPAAAMPAAAMPTGTLPAGTTPAGTMPAGTMPAPAAGTVPAADPGAVRAPIEQLDAALLKIMHAGKQTPFQQRVEMLAPAIDHAFDLAQILRVSVGPGWSAIDAAEQKRLLDAFRRYTIASYVDNFDGYDGEKFVVTPEPRALAGGQQVVLTRIVSRSGETHQLDYVMRQTESGWRVVDVLADGSISRVAVQRADFRHLLDQGGAPALMASLEKKVRDLSGG